MEASKIAQALAEIPGLRVTALGGSVSVYLSAIDDTIQLEGGRVETVTRIVAPNGEPAIEAVVGGKNEVWRVIIVADDVVFAPVDSADVLDSQTTIAVVDAPDLVAYSEMKRDAEGIALLAESGAGLNLDEAAGALLLVRCLIAGAIRVGLRPVRPVAWWQRGFEALGGNVGLPPFRTDRVWDELLRDAAHVVPITSGKSDAIEPLWPST